MMPDLRRTASYTDPTCRSTGAVTYFYITEDGYLQPGELPFALLLR